ncbi:MAG: COG2426 family protein [Desulfurococcales archaeon]|nr:COG2426 family protein [Desulfurococcales archaeon]
MELITVNISVYLYVLGLIPTFEGRYVVVVAAALHQSPAMALTTALASVITLSLVLPCIIPYIDVLAGKLQSMRKPVISPLASLYLTYVMKARVKAEKYSRKYGFLGLTLFIAVPLPGTGIWTGTLGAYLLGIPRRQVVTAAVLGGALSVFTMFAATYPLIELVT